jgi:hypothetical protein
MVPRTWKDSSTSRVCGERERDAGDVWGVHVMVVSETITAVESTVEDKHHCFGCMLPRVHGMIEVAVQVSSKPHRSMIQPTRFVELTSYNSYCLSFASILVTHISRTQNVTTPSIQYQSPHSNFGLQVGRRRGRADFDTVRSHAKQ